MGSGNTIGSLLVSLGLDAAEFTSGLTKQEYAAKKSSDAIKAEFESIKGALTKVAAALGIGLSVNAFKDVIIGAIDAQVKLGDLAQQAGLTGAQLSSLGPAAKLAHTPLEDVAAMSAKLSKALLEFQDTGGGASAVIRALGFSAKDIPRLLADPAQAVFEFSKALNELPLGGTKTAATLLLIGKAGGATAEFMANLAEQTSLVAKRTNEEIENAQKLDRQFIQLQTSTDAWKTTLANALAPTISDVVKVMIDAQTASGGLKSVIQQLAADGSLREWAKDTAMVLGTVAESLIFMGRTVLAVSGSFKVAAADIAVVLAGINAPKNKITGSLGFSPEEADKANAAYDAALKHRNDIVAKADQGYIDLVNKNATAITEALTKQFDAGSGTQQGLFSDRSFQAQQDEKIKRAKEAEARVQAAVAKSGAAGSVDDPAKKILEGQLRALRDASEQEKAILAARNDAIAGYYDAGLISLKDYFEARKDALAEDVRNTQANYEATVALLRNRIATPGISETERVSRINEIGEATHRQGMAQIAESAQSTRLWFEQQKATDAYRHAVEELGAQILELGGQTAAANAIRFKNKNEELRKQQTASGDNGALAQLDYIGDQKKKQDLLSESALKYSNITEKLGIEQARLDLAAQTGLQSEIDGYAAKADLANKYIGLLNDQIAVQQKLAESLGAGPAKDAALLQIDRMKLGIEQLKASADGLKNKFDSIFTSNLTTFFDDITKHTKSVSQAFKDMGKSIGESILHMVNEQLAKQLYSALFGGSGLGQSPGGALAELFGGAGAAGALGSGSGGGGGGAGGAGLAGIVGAIASKFSGVSDSIGAFFGANPPGAVTADLPLGDAFNAWLGGMGFAGGTNYAPGGRARVNERGGEIINLPRGSQVIPHDVSMAMAGRRQKASVTNIFNTNVLPGANSASVSQATAEQARQQRAAQSRIG